MSIRNIVAVISRILSHPLNRRGKVRALFRFVWWQVRARLSSGPLKIEWVGDARLLARIGDSGLTGNIYAGLIEFPEMSFLLHALRQSDGFVDVGANAGCYSILASKVVGANSFSFEPVPGTFDRLVANLQLNDIEDRVVAYNKGLSDKPGTLLFSAHEDSMNHVVRSGEQIDETVMVEVTDIDQLELSNVFLMKIDVEGFELPVLKGATRLLSDPQLSAVILELNGTGDKYGYSDEEVVSFMAKFRFLPYQYDPWRRTLSRLSGKDSDNKNTIFVRDLKRVEKRLETGSSIQVNGRSI